MRPAAGEETVITEQLERPSQAHPAPQLGAMTATIYERLPYALVVVDEQGSVLSANPAAVEMGWRADGPHRLAPDRVPRDVRLPARGRAVRHGCLVQRASQTGETLPGDPDRHAPQRGDQRLWVR